MSEQMRTTPEIKDPANSFQFRGVDFYQRTFAGSEPFEWKLDACEFYAKLQIKILLMEIELEAHKKWEAERTMKIFRETGNMMNFMSSNKVFEYYSKMTAVEFDNHIRGLGMKTREARINYID